MPPRITIISTGSELTAGRSIDTNSGWIAMQLFEMGWKVRNFLVLPDDPRVILTELKILKDTAQKNLDEPVLVIMTGGLGATEDDYTLQTVLELAGKESEPYEKARIRLQMFYTSRGKSYADILPLVLRQVYAPEGAKVLENSVGLAVGFIQEIGTNSYLVCMPGVPSEMKEMFNRRLLPFLKRTYDKLDLFQETKWIWNIGESLFQEEFIKSLDDLLGRGLEWGVTAQKGFIKAIFQARQKDLVEEAVLRIRNFYKDKCSDDVFEQMHNFLLQEKKTLCVAESCTGGLLGKKITDVTGSSQYFLGGVITYSNLQKEKLLNVNPNLISEFGAVSREVCLQMVNGISQIMDGDFAISITGIAGPDGGSETKPTGTVWIGRKRKGEEATAHLFNFPGNRETVRENAANTAIFLLQQLF